MGGYTPDGSNIRPSHGCEDAELPVVLDFTLTLSRSDQSGTYRVSLERRGTDKPIAIASVSYPDIETLKVEYLQPLSRFIDEDFPQNRLIELGNELSRLALPPPVLEALSQELKFDTSLNPVRLRLRVEAAELVELPWEFVRWDSTASSARLTRFLGLQPHFHIVRQQLPPVAIVRSRADPLRVLIAWADPRSSGYPALLGLMDEVRSIIAALNSPECRRVVVEELPHASPSTLQRSLSEQSFHIFHFLGHGDVRPSGGALVLEGAHTGTEAIVYIDELSQWLSGTDMRIAMLSACLTASPVHGVAQTLSEHRVPAVIAMQLPLRDSTAGQFARAFYSSLITTPSVEQAVSEGRQSVQGAGPDWGVPVLYLAAEDGSLFQLPERDRGIVNLPVDFARRRQRDYIGQTEVLSRLRKLFHESDHSPVALVGQGASGKTYFAVEYAQANLADYPAGIFWLDATDSQRLEEDYLALAVEFGIASDLPAPERTMLVRERLQRLTESSLIIFDNLSEGTDLTLLPPGGLCHVLVTTRIPYLERFGFRTIPLPMHGGVETDLLQFGRGRMIGRGNEWSRVQHSIDRCAGGAGGIVLICGEAGIGKSRLMREASVYARLRGFQVLRGQCEPGEMLAYEPFAQVVLQYLRATPSGALQSVLSQTWASQLVKLSSTIAEHLSDATPAPELEPQLERRRLFDSLSQFFERITHDVPLILLLENLHWSDEPSLAMLQHLARLCPGIRLLIIGSYRDMEVDLNPALERALLDMNRERLHETIAVRGLVEAEVLALLHDLLRGTVQVDFLKALCKKTEGNPFFVEETIRELIEDGTLTCNDDEWRVQDTTQLELPETVQTAIRQHTRRLSEESQRLLSTASVIGRQFTFDVLERAMELSEDALLDLLDEVLSARLVLESKQGHRVVYSFRHDAIREALYGGLNLRRKARFHAQVGQALESLSENNEELYGTLAHHFTQTDRVDKAAFYLLKAGQQSQRTYDNQTAIRCLRDALASIEQLPQKTDHAKWRLETLASLGQIYFTIGEHAQAEEYFRDALDDASASEIEVEDRAALHFKVADAIHWQERYQESIEWAERGLLLVEGFAPSQAKACLLDVSSRSYHALKDVERAASYAFRIAEFVRSLDYFEFLYELYYRIAFWTAAKREFPFAFDWLNECRRICEARGDERGVARCIHGMGDFYRMKQDWHQAAEHFLKSLEISERIGDAHITVENLIEGADVLILAKRLDEAAEHAEKGLEVAKAIGRSAYIEHALETLARLAAVRDDRHSA